MNGPPVQIIGTASSNGLPIWVIYATLIGFGVLVSFAALYYALRTRKSPLSYIKGLIGGIASSSTLAAISTQIGGLQQSRLTWIEAGIVAAGGFIIGAILFGVLFVVLANHWIIKPLKTRYGVGYAIRVKLALFSGVEPIADLLKGIARRSDTDAVWDEFCVAVTDMSLEMRNEVVEDMVDLFSLGMGENYDAEDAIQILRDLLEPHLQSLAAKLSRTTLNFTVWRINESDRSLDHLASFPDGNLHMAKKGLSIWKDPKQMIEPGSLAGRALLENQYCHVRAGEKDSAYCEKRRLGTAYDAVGCIPISQRPLSEAPWGVLCVESRDGTIPLDSHSVRHLMGRLAGLVGSLSPAIANRTIDEVRFFRDGRTISVAVDAEIGDQVQGEGS